MDIGSLGGKVMVSLIAVVGVNQPAQAAETFLCDATQASSTELAVLEATCPIGAGLWGQQQPNQPVSMFWIQCGIFAKPLTLEQAKPLYEVIQADVWARPEERGSRCLIGPYASLLEANIDLREVKRIKGYREAFVRAVYKPDGEMGAVSDTVVNTVATDKPKIKLEVPPMIAKSPAPASHAAMRLSSVVNGVSYNMPDLSFGSDAFYMEYGKPWTRLSYTRANQICQQLNMRLPSVGEWQQLIDSRVLDRGEWPVHLPYWGEERTGLFTTGRANPLSGQSLLNVMCVK
ncbi:SPOR domain-containing protein [Vibrio sp. WXL103]|uniref:SPOR domain-containing protein n=1 Tax=unclassified Vibrio TaxID=2614977 RepID=UPI003EC89555